MNINEYKLSFLRKTTIIMETEIAKEEKIV